MLTMRTFECASAPRVLADQSTSSTASHRGPHNVSRMDVRRRKSTPIRVEPGNQLVAEVIGHHLVVTRKARERDTHVRLGAQRQRRQVETRGPALGPHHQRVHAARRETHAGRGQELARLRGGHRQVAGAKLEDPPMRSQAAHGEARFAPGGQHNLGTGRHRARHIVERGKGVGRVGQVRVVQHEHRGRLRVVQRSPDRPEQPVRIRVVRPKIDPREPPPVTCGPFRQKRGLAVPRGRDEQDERMRARLGEPPNQPTARNGSARTCGRTRTSGAATPGPMDGGPSGD